MIRVCLVEDQTLVREGIKSLRPRRLRSGLRLV